MSAAQYVRPTIFSVLLMGGVWQLYCMTPAGAAEREQTRRQKEIALQALQKPTENTQKGNI